MAMTQKKVEEQYIILRNTPELLLSIIKYIGGRVPTEIRLIVGKSIIYANKLRRILPDDERGRRLYGLYIAAAELRRKRPHNAMILAQIFEERDVSEAALGVGAQRRRIERDYDYIYALHYERKLSYKQIAKELIKKLRYHGTKLHPDTIRKICKEIESERQREIKELYPTANSPKQ